MEFSWETQTLCIAAKSNAKWLVYRVETSDACYLDAIQREVLRDSHKQYADPKRARRSRYAGTFVTRTRADGTRSYLPYEAMRQSIAGHLCSTLKSRMFCTCKRWPLHSLPMSPAEMGRDNLGCSLSALVEKFEHRFEHGMSWDNFGLGGWVIDHITPVSAFDFRRVSHIRRACHHTNIRPCWEAENMAKGAKLMKVGAV